MFCGCTRTWRFLHGFVLDGERVSFYFVFASLFCWLNLLAVCTGLLQSTLLLMIERAWWRFKRGGLIYQFCDGKCCSCIYHITCSVIILDAMQRRPRGNKNTTLYQSTVRPSANSLAPTQTDPRWHLEVASMHHTFEYVYALAQWDQAW